jgi:hypothetical protein
MISQKEEMRTGTESSGVVLHDMIERIYFYFIIFSQKRNGKCETHGRRGSSRDIVALVQKKRMQNVPSMYVCTFPPRPPPANHKPQTREPWPYQADFGTTISNSFLGQISYLRWGNPLRASALVTHRVCFASAACGCSFL